MADAEKSPGGQTFPRLGSYQILRQLGSGGMSNVFQAIHAESGSIVALKVLPRQLAQNATLLQRFLREAKSAENLDHPSVVAIYDRGFDQGRHYLVLEFVEGRDLFDRVRMNGPLKTPEAVAYIREVALGLQYAAGLGMIHRDVKPANLLMTPGGHAKIIDLGLAFQADDEDERVTRDGTTVGTVDYMSPEQARDSRRINERSDIYSLGCTLYYLMTGYPPFPGGTLADKLARHHSAPIPNVRDRVSDIPIDFAALIQRMMAKKPDQRFANYQELIDALDQIGKQPEPAMAGNLPDVLIDDADDDEDAIELTVADSTPIASASVIERTSRKNSGGLRVDQGPPTVVPEISLSELAALDADQSSSSTKRRALAPSSPPGTRSSAVVEAILEDEEEVSEDFIHSTRDELPLKTCIAAGIMVGLVVATVAFGVQFVLSFLRSAETDQTLIEARETPRSSSEVVGSSESNETGTYSAPARPIVAGNAPGKAREFVGPLPPVSRPAADRSKRPPEPSYSKALVERLGFDHVDPVSGIETTPKVTVDRLARAGDPSQTASLAVAFGRPNDIVEIADGGPFHEDDYQLAGKSRIIRARAGFRPILRIEAPTQPSGRDQDARLVLGMGGLEQLTIEGLDIVVDVRDLAPAQTTLILCQGVDVTLRDCSITVANAGDRLNGFSLFRLANGPRRNRLRLERCLIRGPILTFAEVASPRAEVALDRTLVVGLDGPLIRFDAAEKADRSLQLFRSILLSRGPLVTWEGKPAKTTIRSLGTTVAHVESATASPLFAARGALAGDLQSWLDYDGEDNRWIGWPTFAQWGSGSSLDEPVLAGVHGLNNAADSTSFESATSLSAGRISEGLQPLDLADLLPEAASLLESVASPHPNLLAMTVDLFPRPMIPDLLDNFSSLAAKGPQGPTVTLDYTPQPGDKSDFGLYLANQVTESGKHYVVRVHGTGSHLMSPVQFPDGASVAITGPGGSGTSNPIPVFFPARAGRALIELHGGDLAIENVGFGTDGPTRTRHWLLIENSLLALRRCRYRDLAASRDSAILFLANQTRTTQLRSGGFQGVGDRPTASLVDCWIWTGADAVAAEIRRGSIQLKNCLVMAGGSAFVLTPGVDQLANLEADLLLENCTVFEDRFAINLAARATRPTGVGRPWVVVSRSSVFPRIGREGGALLGVESNLFARGALFWQSSKDLYDVGRFLAANDGGAIPPGPSADLKRQWVDLWGSNHTRDDRGPSTRTADRVLHFRDASRSRATRPTPSQLELDSSSHSGQGVNFKTIPPIPRS